MKPLLITAASLVLGCFAAAQVPLHVKGTRMVDPQGKPVTLRGCNLGNWLMVEMWMLGVEGTGGVKDQADLFRTLDTRFGRETRESLMDTYRANYITDKDFDVIKSYRFNLVRLPFDYRLLEDDAEPMKLRPNAFKWLDKCVEMAHRHGIYVILDMHGIQGGQSPYDHTGESEKNKFWTDEEDQKRACWLWNKIASRYRNNPTVLAYDLMNEPYGGTKEQEKKMFPMLYRAARSGDPNKLILVMGHWDNFDHYGDLRDEGFTNYGFEMHYYPGLFGNGRPTIQNHAKHLADLADVEAKVKKLDVPFLVGEMNPVFDRVGVDMMRRTYEVHESYGWMTTMWSYKVLTAPGGFYKGSWAMITNTDKLAPLNFKTDSAEAIRDWFASLGTMRMSVYDALRDTMAPAHYALTPLKAEDTAKPPKSVPYADTLEGWSVADIGGAIPGGLQVAKNGQFVLWGGGDDVWNAHDAARFLYKKLTGDFDIQVTLDKFESLETYAKAGIWIRPDLGIDSASMVFSTFTDGGLQFAERRERGGNIKEVSGGQAEVPNLVLRVVRKGSEFTAYFKQTSDAEWKKLGTTSRPDLGNDLLVGLIALSHDGNSLTDVHYSGLTTK